MPKVAEKTRRAWAFYRHLQRAIGIPRAVATASYGAGVLIAVSAPLPWYWRLVLFLVVAALLSAIATAAYVGIFYERLDRTRKLRKLFHDAGERLRKSATRDYRGSAEEAIRNEFLALRCDILVFQALTYSAAVDCDDFVNVTEWRATQAEQKLNKPLVKAEYLTRLADTLTFPMIEPTFHIPANLDVGHHL